MRFSTSITFAMLPQKGFTTGFTVASILLGHKPTPAQVQGLGGGGAHDPSAEEARAWSISRQRLMQFAPEDEPAGSGGNVPFPNIVKAPNNVEAIPVPSAD